MSIFIELATIAWNLLLWILGTMVKICDFLDPYKWKILDRFVKIILMIAIVCCAWDNKPVSTAFLIAFLTAWHLGRFIP